MPDKSSAFPNILENQICYSKGIFDKKTYNDFIKCYLTTKENYLVDAMFNSNDDYINYISIGLKSEAFCCYDELLLLEINNLEICYLPVIIPNINTSSPYSLMRCYTDDDSEDEYQMTLGELQKIISKNYNIKKIINIINEKYI